jgi:hypothetical protein
METAEGTVSDRKLDPTGDGVIAFTKAGQCGVW